MSDSIYFSDEHDAYRTYVRNFLGEKISPYLSQWECDKKVGSYAWGLLGDAGFLNLNKHKDFFYDVIFLEELGRLGYGGFRVAIAVHTYMANSYIAYYGSDYLKQRYLAPATEGRLISALAITEPQAGSDLNQLQTTATLLEDSYTVNGTKRYIANGSIADFLVVAIKTKNHPRKKNAVGATGVSLFVIDSNAPGIEINPIDMLGWHSAATCEINFDNVQISKQNIIGDLNQGFIYLMKNLQLERLVAGIMVLGEISYSLDQTIGYLKSRIVHGKPLSKLQIIRHRIANLTAEYEAIKQFAYNSAWLYSHGKFAVKECTIVKLKATELSQRIAKEALQMHGAAGYEGGSEIARIYRDTPAAVVAAGTNDALLEIIAQAELG